QGLEQSRDDPDEQRQERDGKIGPGQALFRPQSARVASSMSHVFLPGAVHRKCRASVARGETVVLADHTILHTEYGWPPSCTQHGRITTAVQRSLCPTWCGGRYRNTRGTGRGMCRPCESGCSPASPVPAGAWH